MFFWIYPGGRKNHWRYADGKWVHLATVRESDHRPNELPPPWKLDFADPSLALRLRSEFAGYLQSYGRGEDDYVTAELIFDELVANVCFHAPGPIEILVEWHSGRAMLHVTDAGPPIDMSSIAFPDPYAEGGRGLAIVNALSPPCAVQFT
jgi:hypothetical protein